MARRVARSVLLALPPTWAALPPASLVVVTVAGRLSVSEAVNLGVWLLAPWALVLATLVVANAALGIGRRRWM